MPHRNHVVRADEQVGLPHHHLFPDQLRGIEHHEDRIAVGFQLGPLVGVQGVLHGQVVQPERLLDLAQQRQVRFVQAQPDEGAGVGQNAGDGVEFDRTQLLAVAIGCAIDDGAHGNSVVEMRNRNKSVTLYASASSIARHFRGTIRPGSPASGTFGAGFENCYSSPENRR